MRTFAAILCCAACSPAPAPVREPAPTPPEVVASSIGVASSSQEPTPTAETTQSAPPSTTASSVEGPPAIVSTAPSGPGDVANEADSTADNFMEKQYRVRLHAFLRRGLTVTGLGLPKTETAKLRAEARCDFDAKLVVIECVTTRPSNNAAFDRAVAEHLKSKKGQQAPPPPEDHPELKPKTVAFAVACNSQCE